MNCYLVAIVCPLLKGERELSSISCIYIVQPNIPILPYDNVGAEWFALERARLVIIGKTPAYPDGQIAAIAKVNGLILVTNNVSDYADFQELQLENWFY